MTTPYTYVIKCIPTGELYYGVRYANGCHPEELWNTYFTSSTKVAERISIFGSSAFTYEIRKTFATAKDARCWEDKVLRRLQVIDSTIWLNQSYGVPFSHRSSRNGTKQVYVFAEDRYRFLSNVCANAAVDMGLADLRGKPKSKQHGSKISTKLKGKSKNPDHIAAIVKSYKSNPRNRGFAVYTNGLTNIRIRPNDTIPQGFYRGSCIKGKHQPNQFKGMRYEDIYGPNKSTKLKEMRSTHLKRNNPGSNTKGKTYDEIYGETKANELRKKRAIIGKLNTKVYRLYVHDSLVFSGSRIEAQAYLVENYGGSKQMNLYARDWLDERCIKVDTRYMNR